MKSIGHAQFEQKKFKTLGFEGKWLAHFGNVGDAFIGIIYGEPGNGKTEYGMQTAKYLLNFDDAGWLSYEQGHGLDLLMCVKRNDMANSKHKIVFVDPNAKRKGSLFEEYDDYLGKRSTPRFVFADSLDYMRMTTEEYFYLKEKYGNKKGLIFMSHAKNNQPKSRVGQDIDYDGHFGHHVKKFIAYAKKNRFQGREDFFIWEEEARRRNPLYFKKLEAEQQ